MIAETTGTKPRSRSRLGRMVPALLIPALLAAGLAACDDKKAQNNTPTKPSATQSEPQTDQSAPATQRPK